MSMTSSLALAVLALLVTAPASQTPVSVAESVAVNQQKTYVPGYPIGDIAIANPSIADFKVLAGRKQILLLGRALGKTTLTIWDQRGVKRHELVIAVIDPIAAEAERELKALLQEFPSVEVKTLGGALVLSGAVSSKDDLDAIDRIAGAANVRNLVRFVPPLGTGSASGAPAATIPQPSAPPAPTVPTPQPVAPKPASPQVTNVTTPGPVPANPTPTAPAPPPTAPPAQVAPEPAPAMPAIEYEIELLEASASFSGGSYATGVEPSGRRLYIGKVLAPIGTDGQVFIGGKSIAGAKDAKKSAPNQPDQGIRLTMRPQAPDPSGRFKTGVLVETNLPIGVATYDPSVWRRARWEFTVVPGEPFGITGSDLLASPDVQDEPGRDLGRTASRLSGLPGASRLPGADQVPVFGSLFGSSSYKKNQTQLLVVIRTRFIPAGGR